MPIPRPLVYLTVMDNGNKADGYDDVVLCDFRRLADGATWKRTELSVGGNVKGLYTSAHRNSTIHFLTSSRRTYYNSQGQEKATPRS